MLMEKMKPTAAAAEQPATAQQEAAWHDQAAKWYLEQAMTAERDKTEDARKTLTQIVEQHADSPFVSEAKSELDKLKS